MRLRLLGIFSILACAVAAHATPIVFIHTGSGSGTLGGTSFSNAAFTITSTGDTAAIRQPNFDVLAIDHITAIIEISGVGTLTFSTPTHTFVNHTHKIVGFSRIGSDLYSGPFYSGLATWDMTTPIGLILGPTELLQWSLKPVETSGGVLAFEDGTTMGTFAARVGEVPEPSTLALCGFALLAVGLSRLRVLRQTRAL